VKLVNVNEVAGGDVGGAGIDFEIVVVEVRVGTGVGGFGLGHDDPGAGEGGGGDFKAQLGYADLIEEGICRYAGSFPHDRPGESQGGGNFGTPGMMHTTP